MKYFNKPPKLLLVLSGISLVLLISVVDFLTKDFFVLEFYIIPVVLVAWLAGRNAGFFMALVSATAALALDIIETPHHASFLVHYWNVFMNCVFFLLVVYFVTFLKETLELKSKFTSTVSHELRTPLAVISESINLVLGRLVGEINDEQKDVLSTALTNAHRLNLLINDILDFQKFESGKMRLVFEENDINKVAQDAYKGVELLGKEKGLEFIFDLADDLPKTRFDKDRVIQVLTNLLGNAIKYTEKGSITVSTAKNGNNIQVAVQDTGCGIKPGDMPRLFKSFERLEGDDKRGEKGTGLGLVISKEIVARHGGKIWAESGAGRGSVFYFTLPVKGSA